MWEKGSGEDDAERGIEVDQIGEQKDRPRGSSVREGRPRENERKKKHGKVLEAMPSSGATPGNYPRKE